MEFFHFIRNVQMTIPRIKLGCRHWRCHMFPFVHAADQDTVVVTATGFEQKIQNAPASISVISKQQIEDKAYRDVTDALRDVLVLSSLAAEAAVISVFAAWPLSTPCSPVNGKRVSTRSTRPNSDNSGIEQGWLPPLESIERIEVIRGPMSSLYGSDAMGGVINVITKSLEHQSLDRFVAWRCNLSGKS